ncbi:MAG: CBS domain-containing protein [Bdellovibrionales bacterium]|nr:CBS domain-containing protein [Bdellovibrionales bacterium]
MTESIQDYFIDQLEISEGLCVAQNTPVSEVLEQMRQEKVSCVVVESKQEISGIFTEHDVFCKIVGQDIDWQAPISDFSSRKPETLGSKNSLKEALALMGKHSFRHIPITDDSGSCIGVLSIQDVVAHIAQHFPEEVLNLPPHVHQTYSKPEGGK